MRNLFLLLMSCMLLLSVQKAICLSDFGSINGVMWFYPVEFNNRFSDISGKLENLYRDGIRIIGIYCPYDGNPEKWMGGVAFNFYRPNPACGSSEDWIKLINKAHSLGMKVITYFGIYNIDRSSDFFQKAARQVRNGMDDSYEASCFRWSDKEEKKFPDTVMEGAPASYEFCREAGKYVFYYWNDPGFDFYSENAQKELSRVLTFWLDTGVDGFMFDTAFIHERLKHLICDLSKKHFSSDKWLTFESTASENSDDYQNFGLTAWFNFEDNDQENDYSMAVSGKYEMEDLKLAVMNASSARKKRSITHAWTPWTDPGEGQMAYKDSEMYLQEAAFLAGIGIMYGPPLYESFCEWPEKSRKGWSTVMNAVNSHKSLFPEAETKFLTAEVNDEMTMAVFRKSADSSECALLLYNFSSSSSEIVLCSDYLPAGSFIDITDKKIIFPAGEKLRFALKPFGWRIFLSMTGNGI